MMGRAHGHGNMRSGFIGMKTSISVALLRSGIVESDNETGALACVQLSTILLLLTVLFVRVMSRTHTGVSLCAIEELRRNTRLKF